MPAKKMFFSVLGHYSKHDKDYLNVCVLQLVRVYLGY